MREVAAKEDTLAHPLLEGASNLYLHLSITPPCPWPQPPNSPAPWPPDHPAPSRKRERVTDKINCMLKASYVSDHLTGLSEVWPGQVIDLAKRLLTGPNKWSSTRSFSGCLSLDRNGTRPKWGCQKVGPWELWMDPYVTGRCSLWTWSLLWSKWPANQWVAILEDLDQLNFCSCWEKKRNNKWSPWALVDILYSTSRGREKVWPWQMCGTDRLTRLKDKVSNECLEVWLGLHPDISS